MIDLLSPLLGRGYLAPLDVHLARTLAEIGHDERDEVLLAVALASRHLRDGNACLRLDALAGRPMLDEEGRPLDAAPAPPLAAWQEALEGSPLVTSGAGVTPLVLDGRGRLYLRRYWEHERALASALRSRALAADDGLDEARERQVPAAMARLFGATTDGGGEPDWQRVAAAVALVSRLAVIAGGPGTGKTSTVVKILALLLELGLRPDGGRPRVMLLAPTGKAAARLVESIRQARDRVDCSDEVRALIPSEAATIHRALGASPMGGTRFRHHAGDPLHADIVIVDEMSMVDLALMRRLVEAVPARARLILLGDQHQLASVEAGAVLAEICGGSPASRFRPDTAARIERLTGVALPPSARAGRTPLDDVTVKLVRSYRFDAASAIGGLARAIHDGDTAGALDGLAAPGGPARSPPPAAAGPSDPAPAEVALLPRRPDDKLRGALLDGVLAGYAPLLRARDVGQAIALLADFRVLCAHRRGPAGVEALNRQIEAALEDQGLLHRGTGGAFYRGRPVIVTRNDYSVGLFNGDVGLVWDASDGSGALRAFFTGSAGSADSAGSPGIHAPLRELAPARLPPHETVFAMTVHKSQGSEFDRVAVVLPDARSPLLTREWLYTAVTRARRGVALHGEVEAVRAAIEQPVVRASGLADALLD